MQQVRRPRVAFVVQRAGSEVNGGAEHYCLALARAMSERWDVEIVTTCARDYGTWADAYAPGIERLDGVTIRRFPVDAPRNRETFERLSRALRARLRRASLAEQEAWMKAQGPYSTPLLDHIATRRDDFELFVFFTYLYATTYFGLPPVAEKAVLVPFAHDEWPIHASIWEAFFRLPAAFAFSTPEERAFLKRRFPQAELAGPTIGIGIAAPAGLRPQRFRERYGIDGPFALYVGRIDAVKGIDRLLADFARYKRHHPGDLQLVLIGRAETPFAPRPHVRALGFLDEESKYDALAAADVLIQPSPLESLSIVVLEAWSTGRPVLVTGASDVLVGHVRRAQGGLCYGDQAEFVAALALLLGPAGNRLGAAGRAYVEREYAWPRVIAAYEQLRSQIVDAHAGAAPA
jgi:glycosyltransferase involved in cell wall biosynthesis